MSHCVGSYDDLIFPGHVVGWLPHRLSPLRLWIGLLVSRLLIQKKKKIRNHVEEEGHQNLQRCQKNMIPKKQTNKQTNKQNPKTSQQATFTAIPSNLNPPSVDDNEWIGSSVSAASWYHPSLFGYHCVQC